VTRENIGEEDRSFYRANRSPAQAFSTASRMILASTGRTAKPEEGAPVHLP